MKFLTVLTLSATAAVGIWMPEAGLASGDQTQAALTVVVTERQNVSDKGGWVIDGADEKTYVNPVCKARLAAAGAEVEVVADNVIDQMTKVPKTERLSCDQFVDAVRQTPEAGGGPDAEQLDHTVVLHVTPRTSDPDVKGFVVVDGSSWTRIDSQCKAEALARGIMTVDSNWSTISSHDGDSSIGCSDLLEMIGGTSGDDTHGDPESEGDGGHSPNPGGYVAALNESAHYTDGRTSETYYLFDPDDHPDATWNETRIGWLVECDSVKFDQVDPIVAPGHASHHLHEFFGNPNVTSSSTTQSLAATPRSDIECSDVNDKSAYWAPAAFQDGRRVSATRFKAYYKSTTANTVPMPLGLRMIAGNASASENQDQIVGWFEIQRTNDLTPRDELTNTIGANRMVSRPNTDVNVVLRMNFPNCWDGVNLDSPDHQSHMAYFDEATLTCPATHPVKVPQLTTFTQYDTAGGEAFSLASGDWFTFHQDFWNAWSPDQMAELNERCIVDRMNCRIHGSGALDRLGQFSVKVPSS